MLPLINVLEAMMRRPTLILVMSFTMSVFPALAQPFGPPPIEPRQLTQSQQATLQVKALLGDQKAAGFISTYSQFSIYNATKAGYWAPIAAENGSAVNQYGYALILTMSGSQYGNDTKGLYGSIRSFFWARSASRAPNSADVEQQATELINIVDQNRLNYWSDVAHFYRDRWIVLEANELQQGPPVFFANANENNQPERLVLITSPSELAHYKELKPDQNNLGAIAINALLGDTNPAMLTLNFRGFDPGNHLYWQTIAAQDGDGASQLLLAKYLAESNCQADQLRAVFWAKKAVAGADPLTSREAKALLKIYSKEFGNISTPLKSCADK